MVECADVIACEREFTFGVFEFELVFAVFL